MKNLASIINLQISCQILMEIELSRQILEKLSSMIFH
jgi:hypothetical protein